MPQSLVKNWIHLVYSTKHRELWIPATMHDRLYAYQAGIFKEWDSPALIIGGVDDHVHALFALSKNHALIKIVEEVKKGSSKWMKSEGTGNAEFYWQNGYAAFSVSASNVDGLYSRLAAPARRNAVWLVSEDADKQLANLALTVGTGGSSAASINDAYMPRGMFGNATPFLKGLAVIAVEQASALGATGDIVLADLSQYGIVTAGIRGHLSVDVKYLSDESVFRFVMRVAGRPLWASAITPYQGGATRSPFVTLAAR